MNTTPSAARPEDNSFFITETAAIHGVYKSVNIRNDIADIGVNSEQREPESLLILVPVRTARVLITASFAVKPATREVAVFQSENPRGANMGDINFPAAASKLKELSCVRLKFLSKFSRNQIITVAMKITEKALCKKSRALSRIRSITLLNDGNL